MEPNDSNKNTDQLHISSCPHEKNVVTDPLTARMVLMFLMDLVDEQTTHTRNLDGFSCPMSKCSSSFKRPLELVRHLITCPELGKGEFECWKCSCWHQFPTDEKEWAEWSGWKSAAGGHQRKRSLGSKMKDTLTETLALRRRGSVRKSSVGGAGIELAHPQLSISDPSAVGAATTSSSNSTLSMESESTSTAVSSSRSIHMRDDLLPQGESGDWGESSEQQKPSAWMISNTCNEAITAFEFSPLDNPNSSIGNEIFSFENQATHEFLDARQGELHFTRAMTDAAPATTYTQVYPHATANSNSWIINPEVLPQPLSTTEPYLGVSAYGLLPQSRDSPSGTSLPGLREAVTLPGSGLNTSMTTSQRLMTTSDMGQVRTLLPSAFPHPTERRGSNILPHTSQGPRKPAVSSGDGPQTWFPGIQHQLETSGLYDMGSITDHMISQLSQDEAKNHRPHHADHKLNNPLTETVDLDMDRPETPMSRRQSQLDEQAFSQFSQASLILPQQGDLYTQEPIENNLFPETEFETATNTTKPGSSIVSFSLSGTPRDTPYTPASISGIPTPQHDICFSTVGDDIDPEDLVCDQCAWKPQGVRENLRGYLRKHKNVHKGIRHHCDMPGCKKSFSRLDNLKTHRREKHGIDEPALTPKPFAKSPTDIHHLPPAHNSFLPIKRTISMTSDTSERIKDAMKTASSSGISSTQYIHPNHHHPHHQYHTHHHQHVAHVLRSAEAIAQAQSRQIQAQTHAQAQAQVQAHAIAQVRAQQGQQQREEEQTRARLASSQIQVPVQAPLLLQPPDMLPGTPRPDSKRNKDSLDLGSYRGVSTQHAALWPAMQF